MKSGYLAGAIRLCAAGWMIWAGGCEMHHHGDHSADGEHRHGPLDHLHDHSASADHAPSATHAHHRDSPANEDDARRVKQSDPPPGHPPGEGNGLYLDAAALEGLGVRLAEIHPRPYAATVEIPGEIRVDPDRRVSLGAPAQARIFALDALPHATVRPGQRLARLDLVDEAVRRQQIRAVEIRAELLGARTERDRTRAYLVSLVDAAPATAERRRVQADLQVLEAKVKSRQSALDAVLASLRLSGLNRAQLRELEKSGKVTGRVSLRTPSLPGGPQLEVAARPVHRGQTVSAGTLIYELVALDRLQVRGDAFEADLPTVRKAIQADLPVELVFSATSRRVADLKIHALEGTLDAAARITHFFLWLPNRRLGEKVDEGHRYVDWEHRAGERVRILVPTEKAVEHFVLPVEALVRRGGGDRVFRERDGRCEPVGVRVTAVEADKVVVPLDGGLRPGDRVVVSGALRVYLALQQKRAGDRARDREHGHRHH